MLEEFLYFIRVRELYVFESGNHVITHYPPFFGPVLLAKVLLRMVVKPKYDKLTKGMGLGRHSKEELRKIGIQGQSNLPNLERLTKAMGCLQDMIVQNHLHC
jgi:hypothetical protein